MCSKLAVVKAVARRRPSRVPTIASVERPLDHVEEFANPGLVGGRRTARVTGQRRRQHVVPACECREHELPGPPRVGEPVQAQKRRTGTAAVGRREYERQR